MYRKELKFDTIAIHGGDEGKKADNSLNNPIFMTSTFTFDNLNHAEQTFSFKNNDYVYTRGNNPTIKSFEKKMAMLEGGEDAVAFSSGMAAISSTLFSLIKPGEKIISHRVLYGSTYNFIKKILPEYGIITSLINLNSIEALKENLDDKTRVIFFETPSNPDLDIIQIAELKKIINGLDIKIVVDNTLASPYFQSPLRLGADIVLHSATKYISGHGDVLGGITISKDKAYIHSLKFDYMTEFGGVLSPFNAWLMLRGLKTMGLRMRQHEKNAKEVAFFLKNYPGIKNVYYPGLRNSSLYNKASKQMYGYGGIVSFELDAASDVAENFINKLKMIKLAVSFGDAETLIEYPFAMTHRNYSKDELHDMGLTEQLIRLSIGLEDYNDIIADLEQALNYAFGLSSK
jgi:methionine-gamma-lyase